MVKSRALCFVAAFFLLATAAGHARAQSDEELRDLLISIYMVTISQDLCAFQISEGQAAVIGKMSDELEDRLKLVEDDAQKLYDQIENQMRQQKAAGLCEANGDWAKKFNDTIAKFGK